MDGFHPESPESVIMPPRSWEALHNLFLNDPRYAEKVGLYRFRNRMEQYCDTIMGPGYHRHLIHSSCRGKPEATS